MRAFYNINCLKNPLPSDVGQEVLFFKKDSNKRVNIVFDILHIVANSPSTLLRTDKILAMGHDLSTRRKGIRLFELSKQHEM